MQNLLLLGALPAALAYAVGGGHDSWSSSSAAPAATTTSSSWAPLLTTSTVYSTTTRTVTSCAATYTNCPAHASAVVVTEIVPISTTVCPVTETAGWPAKPTWPAKPEAPEEHECSTSTSFSECVHTVTTVSVPYVTTTWVPAATTVVCPVKETPAGSWPAGPWPTKEWTAPGSSAPGWTPTGTGSWTKPTTTGVPVVTAGAADFGVGAIKMLGAAAAAAVLAL